MAVYSLKTKLLYGRLSSQHVGMEALLTGLRDFCAVSSSLLVHGWVSSWTGVFYTGGVKFFCTSLRCGVRRRVVCFSKKLVFAVGSYCGVSIWVTLMLYGIVEVFY